jgi:hypothetical protein
MITKRQQLMGGIFQLSLLSAPAGLFIFYSSFHRELSSVDLWPSLIGAVLLSISQSRVINWSASNELKFEWFKNGDNQIYLFLVFMSYFIAIFTMIHCLNQCSLKTTAKNYPFTVTRHYRHTFHHVRRIPMDTYSYCTDLDSPVFGSMTVCNDDPGIGFLYHEVQLGDVTTVAIQKGRLQTYFALSLIVNKNGFKVAL